MDGGAVERRHGRGRQRAHDQDLRAPYRRAESKSMCWVLPSEVTEWLFVVRRMFRVNDGLPEDSAPRWE